MLISQSHFYQLWPQIHLFQLLNQHLLTHQILFRSFHNFFNIFCFNYRHVTPPFFILCRLLIYKVFTLFILLSSLSILTEALSFVMVLPMYLSIKTIRTCSKFTSLNMFLLISYAFTRLISRCLFNK